MNNCNKKKKRSFFSMFSYFDCNNCNCLRKNESQVIGHNAIFIYSIIDICELEKVSDELICFNKMLPKLLYEFSIHQEKNIFLWFDGRLKLEDYDDIISSFLDFGYNIHVIRT